MRMKRDTGVGWAIVLSAMMVSVLTALGQPADSPWPVFQHDAQRTGRSPYIGPASPTLKWTFTAGNQIRHLSAAIGSDGTVYFGSWDFKFYALNPDGTLKWSYPTGNSIEASPGIAADGTIYISSKNNMLYALNPDGSLKWSSPVGGFATPAIGTDGTIYVGSPDSRIYALNPDGSLKWSYKTGSWAWTPALAPDGTIYAGSSDTRLYALNSNGTLKWSYQTGSYIDSTPMVAPDGTIYFGAGYPDNKVYALNANGSLKWSYLTGDAVRTSPALGIDGTIYVGSDDQKLYAFNPNGSLKWSYNFGLVFGVQSSAAIDPNGTIYVGTWGIYALNPNGTLLWSYPMGYTDTSPAIGGDGTIYLGTGDKNFYAIGPGSGTNDVGVFSIDAPSDIVEPYSTESVIATVSNYGDYDETFSVICTIDGYSSSRSVSLKLGESKQVVFDNWTSGDCGTTYTMTVTTNLSGDDNPGNNSKSKSIYVDGTHDAGAFSIDAPPDTVEPLADYIPQATIENLGACIDTIEVTGTIDGYTSVRTAIVSPGGTEQVTFDSWTSGDVGETYALTVTVYHPQDENPDNDTISRTIVVGPPDVMVMLTPDATTVERGGTLGYTVEVFNNTEQAWALEYWSDVYLWTGEPYKKNPVFGPRSGTLPAGKTKSAHVTHRVPNGAPLQTYTMCGRIGFNPNEIWDESCFEFTVVEGPPTGYTGDGWAVIEDTF